MSGCYLYGKRIGDHHLWPKPRPRKVFAHGAGPLCDCCGLPFGTWEWEEAADMHEAETGHGLGTGACDDVRCDEREVITHWRREQRAGGSAPRPAAAMSADYWVLLDHRAAEPPYSGRAFPTLAAAQVEMALVLSQNDVPPPGSLSIAEVHIVEAHP